MEIVRTSCGGVYLDGKFTSREAIDDMDAWCGTRKPGLPAIRYRCFGSIELDTQSLNMMKAILGGIENQVKERFPEFNPRNLVDGKETNRYWEFDKEIRFVVYLMDGVFQLWTAAKTFDMASTQDIMTWGPIIKEYELANPEFPDNLITDLLN